MRNAYAMNTLEYDADLCTGCWMCVAVCPHAVFARGNGTVRVVNALGCMECGACEGNCPSGAITVDSGVGCAYAMILAALTGREEAPCGGGRAATCCGPAKPEVPAATTEERGGAPGGSCCAAPEENDPPCCGGDGR